MLPSFRSFKGVEKATSEANLRLSASAYHKLGDDCASLRILTTQLSTLHSSLQHRVNGIKEKIVKVGAQGERDQGEDSEGGGTG